MHQLQNEKVSSDKLLRTFNDHVQVDFLFIRELGKEQILHVRDKATGYSATVILSSRDMNEVATAFVRLWINSHGPPKAASADAESWPNHSRICSGIMGYYSKKGLLDDTARSGLLSPGTTVFACSSKDS